jgi:hypothetical protein
MGTTEYWLSRDPIRHVKNRFPTETKYGCEKYAYFDKYMITTASHIFSAYMICGDSIESGKFDDSPADLETSDHFHKLFLRAGGYSLEFDTYGDPHYDSSGLGRVHRYGAPSAICLTLPCADEPNYRVDSDEKFRASLCPGKISDGEIFFACDSEEPVKIISHGHGERDAFALLEYAEGLAGEYSVSADGVAIKITGDGTVIHMLPIFSFDGESETEISVRDGIIEVSYLGWVCKYKTSGAIRETNIVARNRSGYYKIFFAESEAELEIRIEILPKD